MVGYNEDLFIKKDMLKFVFEILLIIFVFVVMFIFMR